MDFYYGYFGVFVPLIILWSLFWLILGSWHAARKGHLVWFLAFLVIHTIGILEIIYLFGIEKVSITGIFDDMKQAYRAAHPARPAEGKPKGDASSMDTAAAAGMAAGQQEFDHADHGSMQDAGDMAADIAGSADMSPADASDGGYDGDSDSGSFD